MLNRIEMVEARPGYRLWIQFTDGVEGEVSLKHLVGKGVFRAWEDFDLFSKATIDPVSGTVTWPGGIDLAPDALYARITGESAPAITPQSS